MLSSRLDVSRRIKSLNVRRTKYLSNIKQAEREIHQREADIAEYTKSLKETEDELSEINGSTELNVSEHALLRYLERVQNVDFEAIAEKIVELPSEDMVVKGRTIVTIWPSQDDHKDYLTKQEVDK